MAQLFNFKFMEFGKVRNQSSAEHLYVSKLNTPVGYIHAYANDKAVTKVVFAEHDGTEQANISNMLENDVSKLACQQLTEYLQRKRTAFDLPLAPQGTEFQQRVWQQLCTIHYGKTASYLDIAKALNKPTASRAVGAANGKNPISIIVPCHRIIGANGSLTGYAGGLNRKSFLLSLEQAP